MATKVWKGHLNFGLLSIPVYLNVGARDEHVALKTFHSICSSPINMPKYCATCRTNPPSDEIVKGFVSAGGYIPITAQELESIAPESEKVMEISEMVRWESVDPIYLAESFYLLPDAAGAKPYSLLVQALTDSGKCAIAQLCKSSREHIVLIRPKGEGLVAHFLYYPNEVNTVPEFEALQPVALSKAEKQLAARLVESLETDFQPGQYENGYDMRLNALIASKLPNSITAAPAPVRQRSTASLDVTEALMASLAHVRPRRNIVVEEATPAPRRSSRSRRVA